MARSRGHRTIVAAAVVAIALAVGVASSDAQTPAGTTNAVLSYVDAADGHVSIVRHWPGSAQDVQVYPYTPYFWDGCLPFQNGALMFLLTSPVGYPPPGLTSAEAYTSQYMTQLTQTIASSVSQAAASMPPGEGQVNLAQLAQQLVTPGNPVYEAIKAALGQINSLSAYEDYGYATFLFVRWRWAYVPFPVPVPCAQVDVRSVPEGYGIPFVSRVQHRETAGPGVPALGSSTARPFSFPVSLLPVGAH